MPCHTRRRRRRVPWAPLAAALALVVGACEERTGAGATDVPAPRAAPAARYADELARHDADVTQAQAAARADPSFWPAHEQLARAHLDRAKLTGQFDDYAGALEALSAAEAAGGLPASCQTGVRVELAVHRIAQARTRLERCRRLDPVRAGDRIELEALGADLAFHEGRYDEALRDSRRVLAQRQAPQDFARLALVHAVIGAPDEAVALLDRAGKTDHAGTAALRAWLGVQRGLVALHRGRWDEALAHYLAADRWLEGWWLVDEHVAEVRALLGQVEEAAALYERLVGQTGAPQLMDGLAVAQLALGRRESALAWIARARATHQQRSERLPEAGAGHAVEHFLLFAANAPETLELARRAAAGRAGGDAHLTLARALLGAGRTAEALREVRALRATAFDTAELRAVAHAVLARAGRAGEAQAEARAADAMNPRWRAQYPVAP